MRDPGRRNGDHREGVSVLQHGVHGPKHLHQQALYDYQDRREDVLFFFNVSQQKDGWWRWD